MKVLFALFFSLPLGLTAQTRPVSYIDSVTASGYFFGYLTVPPYQFAYGNGHIIGDYYFVSDSVLLGKSLMRHMQDALANEQIDKEKYLSQAPHPAFQPFERADSLTISLLSRVIHIRPFEPGEKGQKLGIDSVHGIATHVKVKWLKLKVSRLRAHNFDNPVSMDIRYIDDTGFIYVYLPLEVITMDKGRQWWSHDRQ